MILNIIVFKNVKIGAFTTPNFIDLEPEKAAVQLQRAITLNAYKPEYVNQYKNLEMFFLGTFDDETGKVQIGEPKFLCSPRELIVSLAAQKIEKEKKEEVAKV